MRSVLTLSGVFLLASCSLFQRPQPTASAPAAQPAEPPGAVASAEPSAVDPRHIGDVTVHRVSGTFRKNPLLLTERTVGKDGDRWLVELTLEDGANVSRLRVHMDREGQVSDVALLDGDREIPATLDDYQALMEKTMLVADENEGLLGSERATCLLGSRELECETKSYRVRVGDEAATLRVSAATELGGRDIDGEITTNDGRVLYRSELVSVEHGGDAGSVAER